jgi:adenosylhomocysteine nucleosidase
MEKGRYIGIISALPVENRILMDMMKDRTEEIFAGMSFFRGEIYGRKVVLFNCGVSKVNAAMYTQLFIDRYDPSCVIFTGVAGSMSEKVKHMDLVLADQLTYFDINPSQLENCFPNIVRFRADAGLGSIILRHAPECHRGLIITGDQFITSKDQKRQLKKRFPEAMAVEMEGCAVAQTCFVNEVPFAIIRCISDLADNGAEDSYDVFERKAAEKSAMVILDTIYSME